MDDFHGFFPVDIFYKAADSAGILKIVLAPVFRVPLVRQDNPHPGIQKGLFTQPGLKRFVVKLSRFLKNFGVRFKADSCAGLIRAAVHFQLRYSFSAFKSLEINLPVFKDFHFQPFREGVNNGCTHAVQTAGNFIAAAAEFSSRVQNCENHSHGRDTDLMVDADRDSAPVIGNADDVARKNLDVNFVAVSGHRFVDCIVNNLINEVVQAARPCRANIHSGAFAHGFQPFQNLYLTFIVIVSRL